MDNKYVTNNSKSQGKPLFPAKKTGFAGYQDLNAPKKRRSKLNSANKSAEKSEISARLLIWSSLAACATLAIAGFGVLHFKKTKKITEIAQTSKDTVKKLTPSSSAQLDTKDSDTLFLEGEIAEAHVFAALTNQDPAKIKDYFHLDESNTAEKLNQFLAQHPIPNPSSLLVIWKSQMSENGNPVVEVVYKDSNPLAQKLLRYAYLSQNDNKQWKIDIPSLIHECTPNINEFLIKQNLNGTIRCTATVTNYFNGRFNEDEYVVMKLTHPFLSGDYSGLHAYVKRQSAAYQALNSLFQNGNTTADITVKVSRLADDMRDQVEINEVLAYGWMLGPESYQKKFEE